MAQPPPADKLRIPLHTSFPDNALEPGLRTALQNALVASSKTAVPNIQQSLTSALEATGWTKEVERYILELVRSGQFREGRDAGSEAEYDAIMERVVLEARSKHGDGTAAKPGKPNDRVRMPDKAVKDGTQVLRKELDHVCEVVEVDD